MQLPIKLPDFLTPLMKQWLIEYKLEELQHITKLGLFKWDFFPNRRNPEKPRRIPRLGNYTVIKESSFSNSIYFFEVDTTTLHVFMSSGFSLAGSNNAKEYIFEGENFIEKRTLLNYIS